MGEEEKKELLERINVLLVSNNEQDYRELKKYGFKNIDRFKSIVRADDYFNKHPEELKKYHVVIEGEQALYNNHFRRGLKLENDFRKLRFTNHTILLSLHRYDYGLHVELDGLITDDSFENWLRHETSYKCIFDTVVERAMQRAIEREFTPIEDYINPNRLPLPTRKKDLRILYLGNESEFKYEKAIAKKLGIKYVLHKDDNYGFDKHIANHLGDYDIIIASKSFSNKLLEMSIESTEQCKDTGRDLTMLVVYNDKTISQIDEDREYDPDGFGQRIDLRYVFGGSLAPDFKRHNMSYRVLRKSYDFLEEEPEWIKYSEEKVSSMIGILSGALSAYNETLLQIGKPPISDLYESILTPKELDFEYDAAEKEEEERQKEELIPVRIFNGIDSEVKLYLRYKEQGLITEEPKGLNIRIEDQRIIIEDIRDDIVHSAIAIKQHYNSRNVKFFDIRTLSNEGQLSDFERVGVYTRKYDGIKGIPKRPNLYQDQAIFEIAKKVKDSLVPLNREAFYRKRGNEIVKKKQKALNRKPNKKPVSE